MPIGNVRSNDPRKPAIVAALKAQAQCGKVTNVRENTLTFEGHCLRAMPHDRVARGLRRAWESLGIHQVPKSAVQLPQEGGDH